MEGWSNLQSYLPCTSPAVFIHITNAASHISPRTFRDDVKVVEPLVSVRLGRFMERSGVLPTTQYTYRKGLGTCDALLCVSHTPQSTLESGQEARIVQIDFSAAFDTVNHLGILYKLCSVGIGVVSCLY